MTALLTATTITTAVTAVTTTPLQVRNAANVRSLALYAIFTYGSGGTNASAWVQTSFDGGVTWMDIANFTFTTSSAKKACNLSASTAVTTVATPVDGTLSANTVVDGFLGPVYRVKYTTTGTYAASTSLAVYAQTAVPLIP